MSGLVGHRGLLLDQQLIEDPYWSSVELLLNMNGADSSTSFVDSSASAKTVTRFSGALIRTDVQKFGGAAGQFDGSANGYLTVPASTVWGAHQAFTFEAWLYHGAYSRLEYIATNRNSGSLSNVWVVECGPTGDVGLIWWSAGESPGTYIATSGPLPVNAWAHLRVCVTALGVACLFIDGILKGTGTPGNRPSSTSRALWIGRSPAETNRNWTGRIDDLRFTTGVARSTSDFTPPSSQLGRYQA